MDLPPELLEKKIILESLKPHFPHVDGHVLALAIMRTLRRPDRASTAANFVDQVRDYLEENARRMDDPL